MSNHTFALTVYKESPHLEDCILSLVAQTVKTNILIVTSTPTDYSRGLAQKYDIPYYVNPSEKKDAATNWSFAISQSLTDLVTIAHQDDIYMPGYVQEVIDHFERYQAKNIQIAFTGYVDMIKGTERHYSKSAFVKSSLLFPFRISSAISSKLIKRLTIAFGNPICCSSVTFNKKVVGNFSFSDKYIFALDWFAWYILSKQDGSFLFINKKLMGHRIHTGSVTAATSKNGIARREEQQFFEMIWGNKLIARALASVYKFGDLDNRA